MDAMRRRVRELRDSRGWSAKKLADRLAELGLEHLDRDVLANFENGRRRAVSVEELLGLALALDVAPVHLVCPVVDNVEVAITPNATVDALTMRAWVRGIQYVRRLADGEEVQYLAQSPTSELDHVIGELWGRAREVMLPRRDREGDEQ
jgi:transcriptional regulator with XRE-family HTH domain